MVKKLVRKIVKIDEEKCNGCGVCVPACVEGALKIIDGKARLISEQYCDGLGACLGKCPQDAIVIEEREAEEFNEEAVEHLAKANKPVKEVLPCGCPSTTVSQFRQTSSAEVPAADLPSMLAHWPIQLALVPPGAPFLQGADLLIAADCAPFAYANFHRDFLKNHAVVIACPKLDDFETHVSKLTEILRRADVKSLTIAHMEVPCCFGLVHMAKQAIEASGKDLPLKEITIGVRGNRKP
jgi:NAD-dependent dihydropyrimidine dehydrogenase PreA subunit